DPAKIKQYKDYREMLDDKDIDVVAIAMPNHWHALATVWACQAGKDVYVEKPASHSIWEGRKMIEAARKYNRIVQIGTQQRSDPAFITLREKIARKELGEVQWIHSLWYAHRGSIGKTTKPTPIEDKRMYDLWCGPRPVVPLMRKKLHYDWHWFWEYGNGDMGNRVIHVIDDVHHVMQMDDAYPTRAMAVGGRFKYDDDATTPNTEFIVMDWKVPIIFGSRNLPMVDEQGKARGTSIYRRFDKGFRFTNLIKCEGGFFAVSRGGGDMFDNDGKRIEKIKGDGGGKHMRNWLDAVRSRKVEDLNADVAQGHYSSTMLHIGNNSYRVGNEATVEQVTRVVGGGEESAETWVQTIDHLRSNGVDLNTEKPILGPWLTFDAKTERFTGDHAEEANKLVKEDYRKPFVIPEEV
ncbi:MAG: Gfo/Idh/MocA family oxidoreductase, partial [Rhodospirillales bacterium]|nr:Gfo/Idh/MocA family oxidoreductase [Rhodospirillales bacterium]